MKKIAITTILFLVATSLIFAQDFFDDFESYNVGEQLVIQNPDDWTTWSNSPGSDEDPYIQNISSNVVNITGTNDLVYALPNWTAGYFEIIFDIYIPEGGDAYFNTLHEFSPTPTWGMQVYFGHTNPGEGNIDAGGALAQIFTFEYNTWLEIKVVIDLDNDWGEFYLDDVLIHGWIWSTGTFGTGTLNQLGGNNFYAWDGGVYVNPLFYIDNYEFDDGIWTPSGIPQNVTAELISDNDVKVGWDPPEGYTEDLLGYNVYKNDEFMTFIEDPITEYFEYDLELGTYEYCVTAIHDWGESWQVCADEVYIIDPTPPAPLNLIGPDYIILWDPIDLSWDEPGIPQWIRWDAGINTGNGIGLTNGGTFSVASHWYPDQLTASNGLDLMEIEFYANGDPNASYIIKVWTGPNGTNEIHSQEVIAFNVDDWNNVVLTTPLYINAATDLWFGYEVTHVAGTSPAGCDDGPAIAYNGDMITTGGGWVSMSVEYGLDYNWNIAGLVGLADGTVPEPLVKVVQLPDSDNDFSACGSNGTYN
ncbi:MAG: fibronectin type III domain-containing protein, partial [Bacteroidales bacterium]|nr:fibronectin type III domain-containing protein [Bacteroidales bacterium]